MSDSLKKSENETKKKLLEMLEEDDEFEEFEIKDGNVFDKKDDKKEDVKWQDDWDDDFADEKFIQDLKKELKL